MNFLKSQSIQLWFYPKTRQDNSGHQWKGELKNFMNSTNYKLLEEFYELHFFPPLKGELYWICGFDFVPI